MNNSNSKDELLDEIRNFLIKAANRGYGNENAQTIHEVDKSYTIKIEDGSFKEHDNYFGGEPYGGRAIVHKNGKPVWIIVYYGKVLESDLSFDEVYKYLKKNLLNPDPDMPIRGPLQAEDGKWNYKLDIKGDLIDFICHENIYYKNKEVYKATFVGGLVDQHG